MNIPSDKIEHFVAGNIIFFITFIMTGLLSRHDLELATSVACLLTVLAGIGKEVWDSFSGGDVDVFDVLATWAGAIPCLLVLAVIHV